MFLTELFSLLEWLYRKHQDLSAVRGWKGKHDNAGLHSGSIQGFWWLHRRGRRTSNKKEEVIWKLRCQVELTWVCSSIKIATVCLELHKVLTWMYTLLSYSTLLAILPSRVFLITCKIIQPLDRSDRVIVKENSMGDQVFS